jgi:hypothetical protein
MPKESAPPYAEWLKSNECKNKLMKELEKAGVPLELRATSALEKRGYRCTNYPYADTLGEKDSETIYRELDIYGSKSHQYSFMVLDCQVVFDIALFVECKFSSNLDFIAFRDKDVYLPMFPCAVSGKSFLSNSYKNYTFPIVIRKIAEANVSSMRIEDSCKEEMKGSIPDKVTHVACQQLIAGCNAYAKRMKTSLAVTYSQFRISDSSEKTILDRIPYFSVESVFPIMVIDENRGLIEAEYDTSKDAITGFKDVGYGIYGFISEDADKYNEVLGQYYKFPVIISNLKYLERCLDDIENGLKITGERLKEAYDKNPDNLKSDILTETKLLLSIKHT